MSKKQNQNQIGYTIMTVLLATLVVLSAPAIGQEPQVLSSHSKIPLTNVKGRIDHFSVDVKGQRLFVAAVANHALEVIDLQSGKQVHTITGLAEPQGVFYDASTNRLYVACALDGNTKIYDGTTFRLVGAVKFPVDADNIRYDARSKSIIVGYAGAKALRNREEGTGGLGFIDSGGTKTGEVIIDAHPESFQLEKTGTRLFVNVPDKGEIEVIDVVSRKVVARWPVTSAKDNFPMGLDEAHHRLFVGTRTPPRLLVFDTESGTEIASAEIAGSSDDLFYDSAKGRSYVLTSQGAIDVFQQRDANHYDHIACINIPALTQTGLFVPEWGKLFAAVPNQAEQGAEIRVYEAK
jgi:DNA-binding beta-propeller fold protein YncE